MAAHPDRDQALALLMKYNKEPFHIQHALTVSEVMRWFAHDQGFEEEADFWASVGLLHDIDYELWPEEHCQKAPQLLAEVGASDRFVHAICSHGYGIVSEVEPEHLMEKILFASDELTGLIGSAALVRPSRSYQDMDYRSLNKKFKTRSFAAGCDRDVIQTGAERLGWTLEELMTKTLEAMKASEATVEREMARLYP